MLRAALACSLLMLAVGVAHAECTLKETSLSGTVVDGKGNPIADAVVEGVWDERDAPGVMSRTKSDATGAFTLPVHYSTYSGRGFGGGEKCDFTLSRVQVTAKKDDLSETRRVKLDDDKPLTLELK